MIPPYERRCYFNLDDPLVKNAIEVARELNEWILETCYSSYPTVSLVINTYGIMIEVGGRQVWQTEPDEPGTDAEEDLTVEACKEEYMNQIKALAEILDDKEPPIRT